MDDGNAAVESMPVQRSSGVQKGSYADKQADRRRMENQRNRDGAKRDEAVRQERIARGNADAKGVTDAQLKYLARLTGTDMATAQSSYGAMTAAEASVLIDQLQPPKGND